MVRNFVPGVILLLALPAWARTPPTSIDDLLARYANDDGTLRQAGARLQFDPPVLPQSALLDMMTINRKCDEPGAKGYGKIIQFKAKERTFVHWGLRLAQPVKAGLTYFAPNGAHTTEIRDHFYYQACEMSNQLVQVVTRLACDLEADTVIVNSAFRDPIMNILEGGRPSSQHM